MALEFISQGRNSSVRQLVRSSNAETAVANTWTISSLQPGLNRRVLFVFSTLNFKGQSSGSGSGAGAKGGGCYGSYPQGANGGIGIAGAFINTNITKAASMASYTITLGAKGNSGTNNTANIQAGGSGASAVHRALYGGSGGTVSSNLVFIGANTFFVPYGGAGGGGGSPGAGSYSSPSGGGITGMTTGDAGTPANSTFFGKSGNGGIAGAGGCYAGKRVAATNAAAAIAFTPLSGATYIYPTTASPPAHGITTWTSNNYGAGAAGGVGSTGTGNTSGAGGVASPSEGVIRLTISRIRI